MKFTTHRERLVQYFYLKLISNRIYSVNISIYVDSRYTTVQWKWQTLGIAYVTCYLIWTVAKTNFAVLLCICTSNIGQRFVSTNILISQRQLHYISWIMQKGRGISWRKKTRNFLEVQWYTDPFLKIFYFDCENFSMAFSYISTSWDNEFLRIFCIYLAVWLIDVGTSHYSLQHS